MDKQTLELSADSLDKQNLELSVYSVDKQTTDLLILRTISKDRYIFKMSADSRGKVTFETSTYQIGSFNVIRLAVLILGQYKNVADCQRQVSDVSIAQRKNR